jgi:hypothetical protein
VGHRPGRPENESTEIVGHEMTYTHPYTAPFQPRTHTHPARPTQHTLNRPTRRPTRPTRGRDLHASGGYLIPPLRCPTAHFQDQINHRVIQLIRIDKLTCRHDARARTAHVLLGLQTRTDLVGHNDLVSRNEASARPDSGPLGITSGITTRPVAVRSALDKDQHSAAAGDQQSPLTRRGLRSRPPERATHP